MVYTTIKLVKTILMRVCFVNLLCHVEVINLTYVALCLCVLNYAFTVKTTFSKYIWFFSGKTSCQAMWAHFSPNCSLRSPPIFLSLDFYSSSLLLLPPLLSARLPPIRVEESSFSQDMQWLLERGVQFADVAFYAGDSGKELGWAHAAVLCAVSPYFRQLLLGPKTR